MASGTTTSDAADSVEADLARIEQEVAAATSELLRRAVQDDTIEISDRKLPVQGNKTGILQDCEFGMILLMARNWLADRVALRDEELFPELGDEEKLKAVVVTLTRQAVDRLTARQQSDKGGESKDDKSPVFFSGEPYTLVDPMARDQKFSANVDAAMLVLGFLTGALETCGDALRDQPYENADLPKGIREWVVNLRNAALLICNEGLEYAQDCAVEHEDEFLGFTCDPTSNVPGERPGLIDDDSRLFFTWTVCETVYDLLRWRAYLVPLREETGEDRVPSEVLEQMSDRIEALRVLSEKAASWCREHFYEEFANLERMDITGLVNEIRPKGDKRLPDELEQRARGTYDYVQNVYHISQYAAIRSLVRGQVTLDEVRTIFTRVHSLVRRDILDSNLDIAEQPVLYGALTCNYQLGNSSPGFYSDDAYYPLVVRSLSGLLSRTIQDLGRTEVRSEVARLALEFKQVLADHYENLIARRPDGAEAGDEYLWSFLRGGPYVFYATQRTIFALIEYANFLERTDEFLRGPVELGSQAKELQALLTESLGRMLVGPAVLDLLAQMRREEGAVSEDILRLFLPPRETLGTVLCDWLRGLGEEIQPAVESWFLRMEERLGQSGGRLSEEPSLSLPTEEWAADTIRKWLRGLTRDFRDSRIEQNLFRRANVLKNIRYIAEDYKPPEDLHPREKKSVQQLIPEVQAKFKEIKAFEGFSGKLEGLQTWSPETLRPILFDYLFREFVRRPERSLGDQFEAEESDLVWSIIDEAGSEWESIKKSDPTAELP